MLIGNTQVGPGHPTYIIAEIGSNHDGSIDQARRLIQAAADTGADAAKFQLYRADKLYPGTLTPGAIPDWWLPVLKDACREEGIAFMCSVFCLETLAAYVEVSPVAVKIASPEMTNHGLLEAAAVSGIPSVLVSTGMSTLAQVFEADRVLALHRTMHGVEYAFLHCVSNYPALPAEMNLRAIRAIDDFHGDVPVGLSDHTLDAVMVPALAVAAGACILEKHLTYDRAAVGPDHGFALQPEEFRGMVDVVRDAERILGDGVKRVQPSEDATDRRAA